MTGAEAPGTSSGTAGRGPGTGRRVAGATGRGIRRAGTATGSAATYTFRQARRASRAEGAGDSGLYRLIELHAFNAAGDAAVAISLAGTLFFAQPGEARGQVALFLGLTMLPFAVVAPLLGPFLDRFSHGRRWAIGATMALRAFLCWLMADAVASQSLAMFPTALGVLVSSKAYGVARAATVPRLLPPGLSLVKANSRISLAGVVGAA
ncbi:MAG: transporter, partial [Marmoricola sp.]|nr:transporter [Marmoricola sp.]